MRTISPLRIPFEVYASGSRYLPIHILPSSQLSNIFIPPHPAQLLPHIQFIPLLRPPLNLPPLELKDRRRRPTRLPPARLDAVVRFPAVASFGTVAQQHQVVFGEDVVVGGDVQVGDAGHDVGVRVGVVEGGFARWEGCGRCECGVGGAELVGSVRYCYWGGNDTKWSRVGGAHGRR